MEKLLYVEDNEDNAYMLTRRLERRGYAVVVAGDGCAGVAMARSERPALIVMDLSLPEMDGWEAIEVLKADTRTRQIPIIALSAHAMAEDQARAMDAGSDDFDTKPVEFDRLLAKIDRLLGR